MTGTADHTAAPAPASPRGAANRRGPFRAGERVQLTDERGRMNTVTLADDGEFHSHRGVLSHGELIGRPEGTVVENSAGFRYQALRPLLKDFVLSMPRGAAVVYPKDAGQIVTMADRAYLTEAMPMAVIWGSDDRVIPVRHAGNAAALAPAARVEVIPDAGHFPHKDHPQRFAKIVHEFIRSTQPATYSRARFRGLLKSGRTSPVSPVANLRDASA